MYHIVEIVSSNKTREIGREQDLEIATRLAYQASAKSGLKVEIQDDNGKAVRNALAWRDR